MRLHRRAERTRGQALVEFALVLPVFLLVVFGLIDLGRAIYASNAMGEAAREAARWGSVQARSSDPDAIEVTALERLAGVPDAVAEVRCETTAPVSIGCALNDVLVVSVRSDLEMITPIVAQVLAAVGVNPLHLESTAQVVVQN